MYVYDVHPQNAFTDVRLYYTPDMHSRIPRVCTRGYKQVTPNGVELSADACFNTQFLPVEILLGIVITDVFYHFTDPL